MQEENIVPVPDDEIESRIRPATQDELPLVIEPEPAGSDEDDEPISLVEEDTDAEDKLTVAVHQLTTKGKTEHKEQFKRSLNLTGQDATRCRFFNCRIALDAIANMEKRINDWIDGDEIEIKHVLQTIGIMEGKNPRPNIIITVWY